MAQLSEVNKMALDNFLSAHLDEFVEKKSFPWWCILDMVNDANLGFYLNTITSVNASLHRIEKVNPYSEYTWEYDSPRYTFYKGKKLNRRRMGFSKDKNILTFACYDGLYYDFIKKEFSIPLDDFYNKDSVFDEEFLEAIKYEWLFNYTSSIYTIKDIISHMPTSAYEKMPAGLYEYIQEQGHFDIDVLSDFYFKIKYGKYGAFASYFNRNNYRDEINFEYIDKDFFSKLFKLITNEILASGNIPTNNNVYSFLSLYTTIRHNSDNCVIDTNRSLEYNRTALRNILDKEKNNILAKKMQKLNFIHKTVIGDYIIIVPQSQEDKQEEGRMQNNCVGYYYDESILQGYNLIYFIRKKDKPNKSYITCRYSISQRATVEARKVNNTGICNDDEERMINNISEMIRKGLEL